MVTKPRFRFSDRSFYVKVFNADGNWIKIFPRDELPGYWPDVKAWAASSDAECRLSQSLR